MRRIAPLALLVLCLAIAKAQKSVPIEVKTFPAVPVVRLSQIARHLPLLQK